MEPEEKIFYLQGDNENNLKTILKEHPKYTSLYLNRRIVEGTIKKTYISVTKNEGESLYIVSEKDHGELKNFYKNKSTFNEIFNTPKRKYLDEKVSVKKKKQKSMLDFIKKKQK